MPAVSGGTTHSPFGSSTRRRKPSTPASHVSYTSSPTKVRRAVHSAAVIPSSPTSSAASPRSAPSTRKHSQAKQRKRQAAQQIGRLRSKLTTPKATKPQLSGPLTSGQVKFGKTLARKTGLAPRVVGAWELAEESSTPAQQRQAQGYHNWLNIGPGAADKGFAKPKSAVKITARFLKGKPNPVGAAGARIPTIVKSAKKSPQMQMKAIEHSGWSATGYGAGGSLRPEYKLVSGGKVQKVKGEVKTRLHAALQEAKKISSYHLPYDWGGGHQSSPAPGPRKTAYDCSGFVSRVLQQAGYKIPTMTSGALASWGAPGPGAITIFANPEHTFMRIGNRYYGTSSLNPGGGAGYIGHTPPDDLSHYSVRHAPGTGKEAGWTPSALPGIHMTGTGTALVRGGVQSADVTSSDRPIRAETAPGKRQHEGQRRRKKAAKAIGRLRAQSDQPAPDYSFKLTSARDTTPAREAHL